MILDIAFVKDECAADPAGGPLELKSEIPGEEVAVEAGTETADLRADLPVVAVGCAVLAAAAEIGGVAELGLEVGVQGELAIGALDEELAVGVAGREALDI